ncbi:MAG TPA: hypothetical protein VFF33_05770 [Ignavibacteriaceae bacterium]|nr:hypothetical protein [Ignavibacteriaceae bacterium]
MKFIFLILFIFSSSLLFSQRDSLYHLSVDAALGYSKYMTTMTFEDLNKNGFSGTFRVMWHPEYLLSLGVESGYQYLYSIRSDVNSIQFGASELKASMISVPLLFVTSMCIFPISLPNFELQGGGGVFFLFNDGELYGSKIYSHVFSFGYHFGGTYLQPVSDKVSVGAQVKYYYISKLQDSDLSLQFLISYKFLSW